MAPDFDGPPQTFGAAVKAVRDEHKLSQKNMAAALGVTEETVAGWERNAHRPQKGSLAGFSQWFDEEGMQELRRLAEIPVEKPAHAEGPSVPRQRWWLPLGVGGAIVIAIVVVVIVTSGSSNHSHTGGHDAPTSSGAGTARIVTPSTQPAGTHLEYADNHEGSPVFAKPDGAHIVGAPPRIRYGTKVYVKCFVRNNGGGSPSITAFYLIVGGTWNRDYVVSDTMSNGQPLGNTDSPNIDPSVSACRQ